ncbi:ornithine cyclodeaminase family protein [Phyllobacterium sp. 628]|uniref:ornithine cyclodeaminase family protein n=1 Tax=Phyllobacterium sp. 628 TaxID=2718938 RepID=UPI00166287C5|nr:ornithine cyclodeaminase family protein [Phyllobacterium sp. 628]QND52187.1 ornithine cyclodeaminase family protein [Phyllobacterium sp. 628]
MTRVLRDEDLAGTSIMPVAIEAVEAAFAAKARGEIVAPPRHNVSFAPHGNLVFTFTIGGTVGNAPLAGFRVYDTFKGPQQTQIVAVWSADNAELQGIILGSRLGNIRTGAIGGVAIRHMSAPDAGSVGIIGSGVQARTQLEAAACVRTLQSVRVFSRSEENRNAFAAEMGELLNIKIQTVATAREAVEGADIVICATKSTTPVVEAAWLKPGAHINTVGPKLVHAHELGLDVAERANTIATDSPEQNAAYNPPFFLAGSPAYARMVDLADIVSGKMPARSSANDITLFCSTGLAGTEVLVAARILALNR